MKNPNGYGSVIDLGKGRRNRYAARVTISREYDSVKDKNVLKYKYIGYSDTRKGAMQILAEYNSGMPIKDNLPTHSNAPTFEDIWNRFFEYKFDSDGKKSNDTARNYKIAYNRFADIKNKKIANVTSAELQIIFDQHKDKSKATVGTMKTVINQMYRFAKKYNGIPDISKEIDLAYTKSDKQMHKPFIKDEIDWLWEHQDDYRAQFILMMIYSGVRPQEFITIETKNVHLEENYFTGGIKTENGRERIIPIHSKVKKFYELNYHPEKKYLINKSNFKDLTKRDRRDNYSYALFYSDFWIPYMEEIGFEHLPHDPRHTFATMMDDANVRPNIIKEIIGHAQTNEDGKIDITNAVYIHKTIEQLKDGIEMI